MAFPTELNGSRSFPYSSVGRRGEGLARRYLDHFLNAINEHSPVDSGKLDEDSLYFIGGTMRMVWRGNLLVPIRYGTLTAKQGAGRLEIIYSLDMRTYAYWACVWIALIPIYVWERGANAAIGVIIGAIPTAASLVVNWFWTRRRFERLIEDTWFSAKPIERSEIRIQ